MPKSRNKEQNQKKSKVAALEKSGGNVFLDLGFSEGEAINIVARLELMLKIEKIIKERGWTQQEAAKVLGISQSRVCELMKSRSEKFTVDKLMILLNKLGKSVKLSVKDKEVA